MKKNINAAIISAAAIIVAGSTLLLSKNPVNQIKALDERSASIKFDSTNNTTIVIDDEDATPWQVYFSMSTTTQSGYAVNAVGASAGATGSIAFGGDYIFDAVASSPSAYGSAYFNISFELSNLYSFTSVELKGIFVNSTGTHYKYTFTTTNTGVVDWEPEIDMVAISLTSENIDANSFSRIALESIEIKYGCASPLPNA